MASDYFAALMRASGLGLPAAAAPQAQAPAAADGIVEEQLLQAASPADDTLPTPAAVPPVMSLPGGAPDVPAADARPVQPQPLRPSEAAGPNATAARADDVVPTLPQPRSAESPQAEATNEARQPQSAPRTAEPAGREERGHALMRVALNWVQGGARQGAADELMQLPDEARTLPSATRADAASPPARVVPAAATAIRRMPALPEPPRVPPADAVPWAGTAALRGDPVPEILEISIGAIHLRVDAPAVQAVPAPAAPTAPSAATPAARPKRGDFERRLLRRL